MTFGVKGLRKIVLGKETTAGTAATPTTVWRGPGDMLEDQREIVHPEELTGILGGLDRTYTARLKGAWSIAETEASFEQVGYLFSSSFGFPGSATSANGTVRIYQGAIPTTSVPSMSPGGSGGTIQTLTVEAGDNIEAERMTYGHTESWSLSFVGGEAVKMSGQVAGRSVGTTNLSGTFTASPSLPSIEEIVSSYGTAYIDAVSGTYGATTFSNRILGGKLDFTARIEPKYTIDSGTLAFAFAVYTGHEFTGELTVEHATNTSGSANQMKDDFRQQTTKLLTLRWNGGSISGAGTLATGPFGTITSKALILAMPIKYTQVSPLSDQNGNAIVTFSFIGRYNTTKGDAGTILVANTLGSLT
jgi:hypothetical protein